MSATLTGSPVAIVWAAGADPAAQNITIPSDCTAVYVFWHYYSVTAAAALASMTLNGAAASEQVELANDGNSTGVGLSIWYNPPTGVQSLNPAWDAAPDEGAVSTVAFVKDGDTTAARDIDTAHNTGTTATSVTLTTLAGDLVLKSDESHGLVPSLSAGWSNGVTQFNNGMGCRLSYISAVGATQVCDSEDEDHASLVAVSIIATTAPAVRGPRFTQHKGSRLYFPFREF
jgi:hypothetical protein